MWQMGGVGPMFGQLGFFHKFAGRDYEDKRPRDRYASARSARPLGVLDARLATREWVMGAGYRYRRYLAARLGAQPDRLLRGARLVGFDRFAHVQRRLDAGLARPGVQRGLEVTAA